MKAQQTESRVVGSGAGVDPAERKRTILRARAKELALVQEGASDVPPLHVVEFTLGSEKYAVEAIAVREVLPVKELTPLPGTPPMIAGIINVRGEILSVVDLRLLFGLEVNAPPERVVVIHNARMEFGLLANTVTETRFIQRAQIQPATAVMNSALRPYVRGISTDSAVILDAESLLSDSRLIVDQEVEA